MSRFLDRVERIPGFTHRRLGLVVFLLSAFGTVWVRVLTQRRALVMIDLEVYREGAQSLLLGRPLYDHLTLQNNLPFTYPPLSAWLVTPFAMLPFAAAGTLWTILFIWATYGAVEIAMRKPMVNLWDRFRHRADGIPFLITALLLWIEPVNDGIFFGQINAFLVLACMADLGLRRVTGRGALSGLAAAVKLVPGVFMVHFVITGQWRLLRNAVLAGGGLTLLVAALDWTNSQAFFFDALRQPERLGSNVNTSNQSIRGALMRLAVVQGWSDHAVSLLWMGLVLLVGVPSFLLARRFHKLGDRAAEVGVVGLMAVLLSPVAWIHHMHWLVVLLPAVVGDGRRRARWYIALAFAVFYATRLPWIGHWLQRQYDWPAWTHEAGVVMEDGFGLMAVVLLVVLWRLSYDGHHQGVVSGGTSRNPQFRADGSQRDWIDRLAKVLLPARWRPADTLAARPGLSPAPPQPVEPSLAVSRD